MHLLCTKWAHDECLSVGCPDILILFIRLYSRLYKCHNVLGEYGAVMDDGRGTNGDRPVQGRTQKAGQAGRAAGGTGLPPRSSRERLSPPRLSECRRSGTRLIRADRGSLDHRSRPAGTGGWIGSSVREAERPPVPVDGAILRPAGRRSIDACAPAAPTLGGTSRRPRPSVRRRTRAAAAAETAGCQSTSTRRRRRRRRRQSVGRLCNL